MSGHQQVHAVGSHTDDTEQRSSWELDNSFRNSEDLECLFQEDFFNDGEWLDMMPSALPPSRPSTDPQALAQAQAPTSAANSSSAHNTPSTNVVANPSSEIHQKAAQSSPPMNSSNVSSSSEQRVGSQSDGSSEDAQMSFKEKRREAVRKSRSKKKQYLKNLEEKAQRLEKETEELEKMLNNKMKRKPVLDTKSETKQKPSENLEGTLPSSIRNQRMDTIKLFVNALSPEGAATIDEVKYQIWDPNTQLVCPLFENAVTGIDNRIQAWKDVMNAIPDGRFEVFEISPEDQEAKQIRTRFTFKGTQVKPLTSEEYDEKKFNMGLIFKMQSKKEIIFSGKSYVTFGEGGSILQEVCMWNHSELVMDLMGMSPEPAEALIVSDDGEASSSMPLK